MSINKKLLLIILTLLIFSNLTTLRADEEKVNLDDEELPAIDPFQGNSSVSSGQNEQASDNSNTVSGLLNGMKILQFYLHQVAVHLNLMKMMKLAMEQF